MAAIVSRLHEYAVPERLAEIKGLVRFDLERRDVLLERHGLAFDRGALKHLPDLGEDEPVDVVLRTSVLRFIRLVSGERNAGLEYLAGKIDIDGDAELALAVGGLFRVPGTDDVAVDPQALDPGRRRDRPQGREGRPPAQGDGVGIPPDRARRDLPAAARRS